MGRIEGVLMPKRMWKLVRQSGAVAPGFSRRALANRARLILTGVKHRRLVGELIDPKPGSAMDRLMRERPEMLGILIWPYQCSSWDAQERISRLANHCSVMDELGDAFLFSIEERLVLADLSDKFAGLRVMLDQPKWFMREGQLVVNLFVEDYRAFSVAFSFYRDPEGTLCAVIGGVQGRNRDDALDLYRDLTKALYGLRPRDLLLEVLRMYVHLVGSSRILAISDAYRHHRHPYFGQRDFPTNYDAIWADRGGVPVDEFFYSLPAEKVRRDFETIKPKKRSLYRKRFEFLDDLESRVTDGFGTWEPVRFVDL